MRALTTAALIDCVKSAWCGVLGVPAVSVNDNFFELGGTSFQILQVKELLDAQLGQPVELIRFFQHPTIAELAMYLRSQGE